MSMCTTLLELPLDQDPFSPLSSLSFRIIHPVFTKFPSTLTVGELEFITIVMTSPSGVPRVISKYPGITLSLSRHIAGKLDVVNMLLGLSKMDERFYMTGVITCGFSVSFLQAPIVHLIHWSEVCCHPRLASLHQ